MTQHMPGTPRAMLPVSTTGGNAVPEEAENTRSCGRVAGRRRARTAGQTLTMFAAR
jgi:hypothetical protein